ncbi:hypothetical protein, partial [Desulfamplus magnetovallimortis]|uniref:hypothetical protein n=1 Tax=Desulfamplus magnetovallimortis TaxID=1246637 RepID=UPI001C93E26C
IVLGRTSTKEECQVGSVQPNINMQLMQNLPLFKLVPDPPCPSMLLPYGFYGKRERLGSVIKVLISFCESPAESRFVKSSSTYLGHHQRLKSLKTIISFALAGGLSQEHCPSPLSIN